MTAFNQAMRNFGVTMAEGGARLSAAMRQLFPTAGDCDAAWELHQLDLDDIRHLGRAQLAEARAWLDRHVDDIYADLQLNRTAPREN